MKRRSIPRISLSPSRVPHRLPLTEAPRAYRIFRNQQEQGIKVVLDPRAESMAA